MVLLKALALATTVALLGVLAAPPKDVRYIVPGARWLDTDGNFISSHAGAVVLNPEDGLFYWFGQDVVGDNTVFYGINVYSSPDLATWTRVGHALTPINGTDIGHDAVVERPKVIYNEPTKSWVLWWHADNHTYGQLKQGVATSPNISGPYTYIDTHRPLGDFSQDFGLFQDEDGQAYTLYSNGDSVTGRDNKIDLLNENFTNQTNNVYTFNDIDLEAPTILRTPKKYYIIMSHKTGYRPNNVVHYSSDALAGPWSIGSYLVPPGTRTYNTQSGYSIRVKGSKQTSYIYMGDQWDLYGLDDSRYVWLPITPDDKTGALEMPWRDIWAIDTKTGEWWEPKGKTYEAKQGKVSGAARVAVAPTASGGKVVTSIAGNSSTLTIDGITGTGEPQWVSFYYINQDDMGCASSFPLLHLRPPTSSSTCSWRHPGGSPNRIGGAWALRRFATVSVNGGPSVQLKQRSTNEGIVLSVPLQLTFNKGSKNSITIGAAVNKNGKDWAGDLDKIVVY